VAKGKKERVRGGEGTKEEPRKKAGLESARRTKPGSLVIEVRLQTKGNQLLHLTRRQTIALVRGIPVGKGNARKLRGRGKEKGGVVEGGQKQNG